LLLVLKEIATNEHISVVEKMPLPSSLGSASGKRPEGGITWVLVLVREGGHLWQKN
jgi:hypothetical protein